MTARERVAPNTHITVEIFGRETKVSAGALAAAEGTLGLAWCHESLSPADETALESAIDILGRLRGIAGTPGVTP